MQIEANVLGISPGTRSIGIAVFKNGKLRDWQLKTFKGTWSKVKLAWILATLKQTIEQHGIMAIVVKSSDPLRTSKALNELTRAIYALAEKKGLLITAYSLKEMELHLARPNKRTLIDALASRFPELQPFRAKIKPKHRSEYERMFEAVAAACMLP